MSKKEVKKGEFELISKILSITSAKSPLSKKIVQGIGDDCAVIDISKSRSLIVSTDSFVEGVHFNRLWSSFYEAGIKATTGAISDLYAMGGKPDFLFTAISIPDNMAEKELLTFYKGVSKVAIENRVVIAGGDTVKSPSPHFSATFTALGIVPKRNVKLRSAAMVGDDVFITRSVGLSEAGLLLLKKGRILGKGLIGDALNQHRRPLPSKEGEELGKSREIHAMIDISDGLSSELWHIAEESSVQIKINSEQLILDQKIISISNILAVSPVELSLRSGEEYAILFTASKKWKLSIPCIKIGEVIKKGKGLVTLKSGNKIEPLLHTGFNHFS